MGGGGSNGSVVRDPEVGVGRQRTNAFLEILERRCPTSQSAVRTRWRACRGAPGG
jgi:hypothetical protein